MDTGTGNNRHRSRGEYWTQDEVRTLSDLWVKEVPIQAIADLIGRTYRSVAVKAVRIGLKSRFSSIEDYDIIHNDPAGMRSCLNCRKLFFSEGKANRICMYCKNSALWDSGNDYCLNKDLDRHDW